jgi:chromosome segregation ATPase
MAANFKTSVFGGFDKEDVVAFIEKTARENEEKQAALEKENASLRETIQSLTEEMDTLRQEAESLRDGGPMRAVLQQKLEQMGVRAESLEREVGELREQAVEYQNLKNHIADIEITAHRRTEEFRTAMIAQMRALLSQQREWCAAAKEQYAAVNGALSQRMQEAQAQIAQQAQQARAALDAYPPEQFDRFAETLSALEEKLSEQDT